MDHLLELSSTKTSVWMDAIECLRERIPRREFAVWIRPVRWDGIRSGVARLRVPNTTFAERLLGQYQPLILESLRAAGSSVSEVRCEVRSDAHRRPVAAGERLLRSEPLSASYAFDNFVVGASNRGAYRAAREVSDPGDRGSRFNPLLIYGQAGLGKTHLLQSIGRRALETNPAMRVFHTKGEAFTRQVVRAVRSNRLYEFRDQCASLELLLVDDIEFIAGLERFSRSTEEFFHVLDSLSARGRQVVITANAHPQQIQNLDSRLRSRLQAGLTTCLDAPDPPTSVKLVEKNARELGVRLPEGGAARIGAGHPRNPREIEGVLKLLAARHQGDGEVSAEEVDRVLAALPIPRTRSLTIRDIMVATASAFGVPPLRLRDRHRTQDIVLARHVAIFLSRELTRSSLVAIGKSFRRDHSTVRYAIRRVAHQRKRDPGLDELVRRLIRQLR